MDELDKEGYWGVPKATNEQDKTLYRKNLLTEILRLFDSDFEREDIESIVGLYAKEPSAVTRESLSEELKKFIGEKKIVKFIKQLEEKGFWPTADELEDYNPSTDKFETALVDNYQCDFNAIPDCDDKSWPSEKQLLNCILCALGRGFGQLEEKSKATE